MIPNKYEMIITTIPALHSHLKAYFKYCPYSSSAELNAIKSVGTERDKLAP